MRARSLLAVLGLLVVTVGALYAFYPPFQLATVALTGGSPVCPLGNAVRSRQNLADQVAAKDRILKGSRRLEKDGQGFERWETPKGTWWIPDGSHYVLPYNLAEQERRIYGTGSHFVKPGDVVLDCGANIGVFVREALNAGAAKVIAIEPAPENIECLRRNFAAEAASGRVIIYPKGVWDKDDFLELQVDPHNSAADSVVMHPEGAHGGEKVPLTTIDKLVAELKLPKVDFIKMDIEGAEVRALNGARGTLTRHRPRLSLSAYHAADHPVEVPKAVQAARGDYRMECGPCAVNANGTIRPDILYFH